MDYSRQRHDDCNGPSNNTKQSSEPPGTAARYGINLKRLPKSADVSRSTTFAVDRKEILRRLTAREEDALIVVAQAYTGCATVALEGVEAIVEWKQLKLSSHRASAAWD
jgi:hypothetical protein